jgi:putative membrane protein
VIATLGLFLLVINGLMLLLTEALIPERLQIDGLGWAILGGIVMGLIGMILESILKPKDDKRDNEVVVIQRR